MWPLARFRARVADVAGALWFSHAKLVFASEKVKDAL